MSSRRTRKFERMLIGKAARKLPEASYQAYTAVEVRKDGVFKVSRRHPVNHARRMRKLYKKYGWGAIVEYIKAHEGVRQAVPTEEAECRPVVTT